MNCGEHVPDDARYLPNPVLVIEVLSPSTKRLDKHTKLGGYFRVPGIQHYVVIDAGDRVVFHRRRGEGGLIATAILRSGDLLLDPPGLILRFPPRICSAVDVIPELDYPDISAVALELASRLSAASFPRRSV